MIPSRISSYLPFHLIDGAVKDWVPHFPKGMNNAHYPVPFVINALELCLLHAPEMEK